MERGFARSPWLVGLLLMVVLTLVAAACGGDDAGDTFLQTSDALTNSSGVQPLSYSGSDADRFVATTVPPAQVAGGGDSGGDAVSNEPPGLGPDGVDPIVFQTTDFGRDIIFTADLTVAVTDVAVAGDEATREIAALGGFLFGQRTTGAPNPVSVLTFKVAPADFAGALDRLGSIGEVRAQNVSASDVTERIVDLESRILSSEASVARLRQLLAEADAVAVVVQVETELLQRETQLETLRGQLRTLEDQVSLATIVVTLTEALSQPRIQLIVTTYPGHDGPGQSCHGEGGLNIDEGSKATVCFEILNVGDAPLTSFELIDPVLDITLEDLTAVFGESTDTIEPGDSIMLAYELVAERDLRTQTRVSASPVNQEGETLVGRTVADTATIFINAVDPGGIPGFGEGLSGSISFLANLGRILILGVGVVLPFIWLLPLLIWIFIRRRTKAAAEETTEKPEESDPDFEETETDPEEMVSDPEGSELRE
ncbi:MAG: DUF4349 domain-containing protein [Acidimicrobiia bacterium]|nr:DUF4349 domain-containing protein [Acidimicrobiia bacterium]